MTAQNAPITPEILIKKYPEINNMLEAFSQKCNLDGRNELFNTLLGCTLITLHDKYDFTVDKLNTIVAQVIEQLECIRMGFVTEADIVNLVNEIGVLVEGMDYTKVIHNANETRERLIAYEGMMEQMTRVEEINKAIDDGMGINEMCEEFGLAKTTVYKYRTVRKKELADMSPAEFTEQLFDESTDSKQQDKPQQEGILADKQIHSEIEKCDIEQNNAHDEVLEITPEQAIAELNEVKEKIESKGASKMGLKKVVKVIKLEGEVATYEPLEKAIKVAMFDGQEVVLTKEQMWRLAEEMMLVIKEEF